MTASNVMARSFLNASIEALSSKLNNLRAHYSRRIERKSRRVEKRICLRRWELEGADAFFDDELIDGDIHGAA